jgi:hypothetical protein
MDKEEKKISEFNESMLQIQRLHNHWLELARFREQGDLGKAKFKLDSIEIELMNDIHEFTDDETNYKNEIDDINKKISNLDTKKVSSIIKLYKFIKEKEIILRKVQQLCGKGSRYKDFSEDEMD